MKKVVVWFLSLAVVIGAALPVLAKPLPTIHDIWLADQRGDFRSADSMMDQVLATVPNSAKAHYVHAALLADENKPQEAKAELAKAESLDPTDGFANRDSLNTLRVRINPPTYTNTNNHTVLILGFILLGVGLIILYVVSRSHKETQSTTTDTGSASRSAPRNPHNYYGGYNAQPSMGSGTTVINNTSSSNDGMLTGVLLGEAMANNKQETVVNETVVNQTPAEDSNKDFGATSTPAPEPAPSSSDFGAINSSDSGSNSSSTDYGTNDSSSSNDFGSSDSSSSNDFGSSDSSSSSDFGSSSDSGGGSDFGSGGSDSGSSGW